MHVYLKYPKTFMNHNNSDTYVYCKAVNYYLEFFRLKFVLNHIQIDISYQYIVHGHEEIHNICSKCISLLRTHSLI